LPTVTNVEAWEQQHEVLRLLKHLPPRQRQVLAWTFDGYTPSEIAEELAINSEAVRSSLKLARRTLAAAIGEMGKGR
jgi:RNA polymerase sigma-70 factor (ECF subfamily)